MLSLPPSRNSVWRVAALSRCFIFVLQIAANFVPDHKADAYTPEEPPYLSFSDWLLRCTLDGYYKWDAKYYVSIAEDGYSSEQKFAFFPLYPLLLRWLADLLFSILLSLSYLSCVLVSAAFLNAVLFIEAACTLFDLTTLIFESRKFSYVVCLLFCINPASIFFSAVYTESLFVFLVLKGLLAVQTKGFFAASLWFMLGSFTRSNGTINIGFVFYSGIATMLTEFKYGQKVLVTIKWFCKLLLLFLLILFPFLLVNLHGYIVYCTHNLWTLSCDEAPTWCCDFPPSIYNHIQRSNWGLGLFKYYQLRKIPNFLLAFPTVSLCLGGAYLYFFSNKHEIMTLGLNPAHSVSSKKQLKNVEILYFTRKNVFCYAVHTVFLVIFALLFMHVEVVTRMVMSSTPFPYWIAGSFVYRDLHSLDKSMSFLTLTTKSKVIITYFAVYLVCGTMLHVNFLPWT